jgi:hypothetical protein
MAAAIPAGDQRSQVCDNTLDTRCFAFILAKSSA